jgi:hypothetical protein
VRALAVFSLATASHGDADAGELCRINFALLKSLEQEPLSVSQRVRAHLIPIAVQSIEQTLNRVLLQTDEFQRLREIVDELEANAAVGEGFWRGFLEWKIFRKTEANLPVQKVKEYFGYATNQGGYERVTIDWTKYSRDEDQRSAEQTFEQVLAHLNEPYPTRLKLIEAICAEQERDATKKNCAMAVLDAGGIASSLRREVNAVLSLRLAQTGIALEQFRLAHTDHYPANLGELQPKYLKTVPTNPVNGNSLEYYTQGSGYLLRGESLAEPSNARTNKAAEHMTFRVVSPP